MPRGVYTRTPAQRITKQEIEDFVLFINDEANQKLIEGSKKPHIAASKLYQEKASKHISYTVAKRAMMKYKVVSDADGRRYAIEKLDSMLSQS